MKKIMSVNQVREDIYNIMAKTAINRGSITNIILINIIYVK